MSSIIIVLPKLEDAKHIKDILARRGLTAAALCTTASMALSQVHQLDSGVVDLQLSDQGHALYTAGGISARLF